MPTQAEADALWARIVSAIQTVQYNGRSVSYQPIEDMLKVHAAMVAALNTAAGTAYRYRVAATSKGLTP